MKRWLPWLVVGFFALWVLGGFAPVKDRTPYHYSEFGRIPVLLNGRVQPFDSVARNALLTMRGKQTVLREKWEFSQLFKGEFPKVMPAVEWLLEVMARPEEADTRKIFRVQHPDVEGLLGTQKAGLEYYSFNDLQPEIEKLEEQALHIAETKKETQTRTAYEKDVIHLYESVILYRRLKNSLQPEGAQDFGAELNLYLKTIPQGLVALQKSEAGQEYDKEDLQMMASFFRRYQTMARFAYPLAVPPADPVAAPNNWKNVGTSLMESMRTGELHPAVPQFAAMATAYRQSRPADFNAAVADYSRWLAGRSMQNAIVKGQREFFFNHLEPFYKAMVIYVAALLLACAFWVHLSETVRRSAFGLLGLAFAIHTVGLLFRMFLEGRPPVTNLYSSAIFVGWGSVVLGIILERIFRGGIGIAVAAAVGFVTQIIAHHLALAGDTMEMLRAVLDTNIWLSTHVVVITTGYASMFVAGLLAIIYIVRGFFTRSLLPETAKSLARMVYGIVCFATLFSFVGTILGGIWADRSWGRFWGWDPKENGALLIVVWCAIVLHARWGGLVRERGLMALAVFGNIVTSFSWFGVNMLGVGLHSYGFMDAAFKWLMGFIATQVVLIVIALLPPRMWASFGSGKTEVEQSPGKRAKPAPAGA